MHGMMCTAVAVSGTICNCIHNMSVCISYVSQCISVESRVNVYGSLYSSVLTEQACHLRHTAQPGWCRLSPAVAMAQVAILM